MFKVFMRFLRSKNYVTIKNDWNNNLPCSLPCLCVSVAHDLRLYGANGGFI